MPHIICADLKYTCDTTVEGSARRDVLLSYINRADQQHRQDAIPLDAPGPESRS